MSETYKFYNKTTGETADVELEKWVWQAMYKDGTYLNQFDIEAGRKVFHQFREIDREKVQEFALVSVKTGQRISFKVGPEMKLIHFYRRVRLYYESPETFTLYVFGYEIKQSGRNQKQLFVVWPDDMITIEDTEDFKVVL